MSDTALQTILYVEDDLHVRTTATLVLEVIGKFTVHACSSGREALIAAKNIHPDLVLLDVMMPELDGLETLSLLRTLPHLAGTPALFFTSLTTPDDVARYMDAGAIGVIPKPLVPLRLAAQVYAFWEEHAQPA
jgi:CheY-like chemotaxis protein